MHERDAIDPESRIPLEEFLAEFPGGFAAIPDIVTRRKTLEDYAARGRTNLPPHPRVTYEDRLVEHAGVDIPVRIYRPVNQAGTLPGIFFIHSGGMVLGSIERESLISIKLCDELQAVVVAIDYRLAPEHPYPAAVDDCYYFLNWMVDHAGDLSFDPQRLAVFGASAGGGLSLATALKAREHNGPAIRYVMAIYPMIDDRNETQSSRAITSVGIWDRGANLEGWKWYLGGKSADQFAAPARATDLKDLPSTFIDVGTVDLFLDEDIAFAHRLMSAGVPTELHVYPGAYHGSENVAADAQLSQHIWQTRIWALKRALA